MIAEVLPPDAPPEALQLQQQGSQLEAWASGLTLLTETDHAAACEQERRLLDAERQAKALTGPAVEAAKRSLEEARKVQERIMGPFARARALVRQKLGDYRLQQKRLADEQAAERRRLATKRAEEDAIDRAVRLEGAGRAAEASAVLDRTPLVPLVVAATAPSNGVRMRTNWSAEVTDFHALIRWAAERPEERAKYLEPCTKLLNAEARALKGSMNIPGVTAAERLV